MKKFILTSVFVIAATQSIAQTKIIVECYRGPLDRVVWDKAEPNFINSLIDAGYSNSQAVVFADGICRNPDLLRNPSKIRAAVLRELRVNPPQ